MRLRDQPAEQAPWAQPFGPPPAAAAATFHPLVRTAAELAGVASADEPTATPSAA